MGFLKYLYGWSTRQSIYFWVLGTLLLFVGVFHCFINSYISSIFLSIFLSGGVAILVGIYREYKKK
jgi:hypothetical protein